MVFARKIVSSCLKDNQKMVQMCWSEKIIFPAKKVTLTLDDFSRHELHFTFVLRYAPGWPIIVYFKRNCK